MPLKVKHPVLNFTASGFQRSQKLAVQKRPEANKQDLGSLVILFCAVVESPNYFQGSTLTYNLFGYLQGSITGEC